MGISENVNEWAGLPVEDFDPDDGIEDPTGVIYRLRIEYDAEEPLIGLLARFVLDPNAGQVPGLVIGSWYGGGDDADVDATSEPIVEALVAARQRLPALRALFLGDITSEENEISWIHQSDVTPLFDAYPDLEHFRVRGGDGLVIGTLRHDKLRSLVVEAGGLDGAVVRGIAGSHLPRLNHLELWLGTENYGGNVTLADLAPILKGDGFPALRYLGLRDAEGADAIAQSVAQAPILSRVKVLDLSLGDLGDLGVLALAASPAVAKLKKIDIHHHYASDEAVARLRALGVEVDADDPQSPDEWNGELHRYISVSE